MHSGHILPLLHGPALMLTMGTFSGGQDLAGTLTDLWLNSPIHSKLQCTLCTYTFLPEAA